MDVLEFIHKPSKIKILQDSSCLVAFRMSLLALKMKPTLCIVGAVGVLSSSCAEAAEQSG